MNDMLDYIRNEQAAGNIMAPAAALQQLRLSPENFLKTYPIRDVFDCQASGPTTAHLLNAMEAGGAKRPGSILGTHNMKKTEGFVLQNKIGKNGEGQAFQVHGIHTGQSSAGPNWYTLGIGGPDIMITAKLTGCTFVVRAGAAPNAIEVAHLQPHQETGIALNTRLKVPGQSAYGRLKYDIAKRSVNVIGVRVGGRWSVYAQKIEKHALAIRSVKKIWPT